MVEGAPHTAKRSRDQVLCLEVPPCPRIERSKGEGAAGQGGGAPRGVLPPPGVGLPPSLLNLQKGGKRREREEGRGALPPSPYPIWTRAEGRAPLP